MLFGNAHVNHAIRAFLRHDVQAATRRHRSRNPNNSLVLLCKFQKRIAEHVREGGVRVPRRQRKPAFGVKRAATMILCRILLGSRKTAALFGKHVHKARALLVLDAFKNHHKFVDVMTVNRSEIADAQILEETSRLHGVFRSVLDLQEQFTKTRTQNARQARHQAIQVRTHLVVNRVRNHAVQVLAEPAHVWRNAHPVIVQDDGHVLLGGAHIVERFVRHTARHGTIANDSNHVIVTVETVTRNSKAKSRRNRSRSMPGTEAVIDALVPFEEAGNTALLAQSIETVVAAGQQFVHVRLVPHVPDNLVVGRIEHIVKRKSQFHNAKARSQMTAMLGHLPNNGLANLRSQTVQLLDGAMFQVLR